MSNHRIKPIVYSDIKEKNILEKEMFKPMTSSKSLVHALDIMDWMLSMKKRREPHPDDTLYPWIILKIKK